ncbi:hypothetical protein [Promicromonospora sp. NPDC057488]|uniref:hypothetical protein n=1 Tax=Promicromonospora sp. NPDC057488 TaxID=3346147 RepID=UPI00366A74F4
MSDNNTPGPGPETSPVTVASVRRVHLSEDWLATGVGLALVGLGLLGLIPEGLVP